MCLRHLDLCSGIGGFTIAAGWAGFETVGFSEVEPYCCEVLREKWPEIPNYGDLRRADFSGLRGSVEVLSAGVPCQPSSLAGKRRGAEDERWLWGAVLDVVGAVEPAWVLLENPVGILTLDEFGGVLLRLGTFGYEVRAFSVPANSVGAKHRRQRIFIVANRSGNGLEGWEQQNGTLEGGTVRQGRLESAGSGEAMADSESIRAQGNRTTGIQEPGASIEEGISGRNGARILPEFRLTEPPLCGRADGLPCRSHRLKCLGNAVIPAQAYPFFEAIAQTELSYGTADIR